MRCRSQPRSFADKVIRLTPLEPGAESSPQQSPGRGPVVRQTRVGCAVLARVSSRQGYHCGALGGDALLPHAGPPREGSGQSRRAAWVERPPQETRPRRQERSRLARAIAAEEPPRPAHPLDKARTGTAWESREHQFTRSEQVPSAVRGQAISDGADAIGCCAASLSADGGGMGAVRPVRWCLVALSQGPPRRADEDLLVQRRSATQD
jgi:hypothetical protein